MAEQKSTMRKTISTIFAFLVSMLLFFTTVLLVLQMTVLSPDYLKKQMQENKFYSSIKTEIETQFATLSAASGFDETFFNGILDQQTLTDDINFLVDSFYNNSGLDLDTDPVRQMLYDKFSAYADEQGTTRTDTLEEGLNYLADYCAKEYRSMIRYSYLDIMSPAVQKVNQFVPIVLGVLLVLSAGIGLFIFLINPFKHRAVRALIFTFLGTMLMTLVIPAVILISGKIKQIGISLKPLYDLTVHYGYSMLWMFVLAAAVFAVLSALCALLYCRMREGAKRRFQQERGR